MAEETLDMRIRRRAMIKRAILPNDEIEWTFIQMSMVR
jgi:hypothetical protein